MFVLYFIQQNITSFIVCSISWKIKEKLYTTVPKTCEPSNFSGNIKNFLGYALLV